MTVRETALKNLLAIYLRKPASVSNRRQIAGFESMAYIPTDIIILVGRHVEHS